MGRPIVVQVGPLVASSATKIALSQKAAKTGTNALVINGATADAVANNICLSQTPGAAGPLTLNGSTATTNPIAGFGGTAAAGAAVAYLPALRRIYITGGSDESGKTFTVVGTVQTATTFGPGVVVSEVITGPNASTVSSLNAYSTIISITASAATTGAITVGTNGNITLDTARNVIITSGGNDTGITFTLTGTDWSGSAISETITGASGAAASSVLDYLTLTGITSSGAVATTVTVGTNGIAGSPWVRLDGLGSNAQVAIQCTVSGTANYTVQQTLDDPNVITNPMPTPTYQYSRSGVTWVSHPSSLMVSATTTQQGNYAYPPVFARVLLNSQTNPGYVVGTFQQAYLG